MPAACRYHMCSAVKLLKTNAALAFGWWQLLATVLHICPGHDSDMLFQNLVLDESYSVLIADQQVRRLGLQPLVELHCMSGQPRAMCLRRIEAMRLFY
jgi:hypothetical protein